MIRHGTPCFCFFSLEADWTQHTASLLGLVNGCGWIEGDKEKAILWRYSLLLYGFICLFLDIGVRVGNGGSLCGCSSCRGVG